MSRYGRFHVPEGLRSLERLHIHDGSPLREVTHEPKCAVLDQQTLLSQGIRVSAFIPGAKDVNALGSCTANATTVAMSNVLPEDEWCHFATASSYADTVGAEEGAIAFYHYCTDQTSTPQSEWPPTDCGSSGPYIVEALQRLDLIKTDRIAHDATSFVSLMQGTGLLIGGPFLNAWEEPGPDAIVDGDGTYDALAAQIRLGVAGGHERFAAAVEKLVLTATDRVTPFKTIIRERNSWGASWGDHGSFRMHLSTYMLLAPYSDYRQVVPR